MSDNNEHNEEQQQQPSISVIGAVPGESVTVEFADGVHAIAAHVVSELGGASELEKIAPGLKTVTYQAFMDGFYSVMASRKLNQFQTEFVRNHFNRPF